MSRWFDDYHELSALCSAGTVICLGNFDGLHRGHQRLLREALSEAKRRHKASLVFTFFPHPARVLRPDSLHPRLTLNENERKELLNLLGFDFVLNQTFDSNFSTRSAESFVTDVLRAHLKAELVVVGENFHFGHLAKGNLATLKSLGLESLTCMEKDSRGVISSSRVRDIITSGDVELAYDVLGYPYFISGRVVRGDGRGAKIGFPTANIEFQKECVPEKGVYAVMGMKNGRLMPGTANWGTRPTFLQGTKMVLEVHFQDLAGEDLYGQEIRIFFWKRLRGEMKFSDSHDLKGQILRDIELSRLALKSFSQKPFACFENF